VKLFHALLRPKRLIESPREAEPRPQGRLFKLAKTAGVTMSLLTLVLFVALLPTYSTHLHTVCTTALCAHAQLSARTAQAFEAVGLSLNAYALIVFTLTVLSVLLCGAIAAVLRWRASENGMALLVGLMLVLFGTSSLVADTVLLTSFLGSVLATNLAPFFSSLAAACALLVIFLFPNGRFVPGWMRWFVLCGVVLTPILTGPLVLGNVLWVIIWLSAVGTQIYRYQRVSTPVEQQQTKWVLLGFFLLLLIVLGFSLPEIVLPALGQSGSLFSFVDGLIGTFGAILLLPLFFGIAILGYRLYDIDVIINRTLVYVGLVIGLSALLRGLISQDSSVAIVLSTLVIAALFQPLRSRIQQVIDRRFYRRKYDAAKIVAAFSATLRQEVDLNQLREQLLAVVQQTMQPASLSLWIRPAKQQAAERGTRGEALSRGGERPGADRSDSD
jgi:hypothetical protein